MCVLRMCHGHGRVSVFGSSAQRGGGGRGVGKKHTALSNIFSTVCLFARSMQETTHKQAFRASSRRLLRVEMAPVNNRCKAGRKEGLSLKLCVI